MTVQAYCMKCKATREMLNPQAIYNKSGRPGTKGTCPVCGTSMFLMGRTDAHEGLPKPEVVATVSRKPVKAKSKTSAKGKKKKVAAKKAVAAPRKRTGGKLVIVESPAKARTVGNFLGKGYVVKASKGHVRDLLVTQLSVDVEHNFEPKYRVPNDKRDIVKELKDAMDAADEIFLATDPDREGEAIAWHLIAATELSEKRASRVVFHEITKPAIQDAFSHPRNIDMSLVNAQQARRILDRLVGYNITELLWSKVRNRLSAGRVQSIAVRLVVDREREVEAFTPEEYWTIDAKLRKQQSNGSSEKPFLARLMKIDDQDVNFHKQEDVKPHLDILERSQYVVTDVKHSTRQRKPAAPFTTSTLQQEASRRLGFSALRTMAVAQQLYEGIEMDKDGAVGLITYMRTDSTNVSSQAQVEAREFITGQYGDKYVPEKAPEYKTKTKGAQEAHEAIRPTSVMRQPDTIKDRLTRDQHKLYLLIWQRFVASQMSNAVYNTMRVDILAGLTPQKMPYLFRVSGSTIKFNGFLALYEEARDEDAVVDEDEGRILPELTSKEALALLQLLPEQHFTQPPPRYTEATLVRTLEEYGIGRPSTYAPTVAIIQDREYVAKQDKRLVPTETGKIVNDMLVSYFPNVMDHHFTAHMEDELDEIAAGEMEWRPMLREFYDPFEGQLKVAREQIPALQQEELVGRPCPTCGNPLVIRYGRFGKFIGCSTYPECRFTEPWLERTGIACPKCGATHGGELIVRKNKRGRTFYGCARYPECDYRAWKLPEPAQTEMIEAQGNDLSA
jgi:DNA topoisomerase I